MEKHKTGLTIFRKICRIICIVFGFGLNVPMMPYAMMLYGIIENDEAGFLEKLPGVAWFSLILILWSIIPSGFFVAAYHLNPENDIKRNK